MSTNLLDMSDAELANLDISSLGSEAISTEVAQDESEGNDNPDLINSYEESEEEQQTVDLGGEVEVDLHSGEEEEEEPETTEPVEQEEEEQEQEESEETPEEEESTEEKPETTEIDYEAEYKRILAPFKANGREIQVDSVDDAIRLMQMGANYNKKMAGLKPSLTAIRLLEKNGLLDQDKLTFLIDLANKDKDAINKLVNDAGIDPLDLSSEHSEYRTKTQKVSEAEVDLEEVFNDLQSKPAFVAVTNEMMKWDDASKDYIAGNPKVLRIFTDHHESGVYDVIAGEVAKQRALGNLQGMNDLDAYSTVGSSLERQGKFAHLVQGSQGSQAPAAPQQLKTSEESVAEKVREKKRKAAAPAKTSSKPVATKGFDYNPAKMTDEEFEAQYDKLFAK